MSTETEAQKTKGTKHRSPAYPGIGLKPALEMARILWHHEKRNEVAIDVAASHWGLQSKSSGNLVAISALKKFGLLTDRGSGDQRHIRLTDLAISILRSDPASADWLSGVRKAALAPKIVEELWQTDRDNPRSTQSLKKYLEFEKDFNPAAIDPFIEAYRDTISFAKLQEADTVKTKDEINGHNHVDDGEQVKVTDGTSGPAHQKPPNKMTVAAIQPGELPVPIGDGLVARVPFPMTEEDFDLLIGTLQLWKKKLVSAIVKPSQLQFPVEAIWKNKDFDKPVRLMGIAGQKDGEMFYFTEDGTGVPSSQVVFKKG
ncbi:MAG: hypothetical protein L0287_02895 [Anaerolineae bacterium]|nr:hypothetical protein [Anaerolineae bacterium]